jgi:hypothetical protein
MRRRLLQTRHGELSPDCFGRLRGHYQKIESMPAQPAWRMSPVGGGFNWSAQHSFGKDGVWAAAQRSEIWDRWQAGEPMS